MNWVNWGVPGVMYCDECFPSTVLHVSTFVDGPACIGFSLMHYLLEAVVPGPGGSLMIAAS